MRNFINEKKEMIRSESIILKYKWSITEKKRIMYVNSRALFFGTHLYI
jgi:hypothetical protein